MSTARLNRRFVLLRALRWLPIGLTLPFLILIPQSRGLSVAAIGAIFAVHSAVLIALEVPSGALADSLGRRRVLLAGAATTTVSLVIFAFAASSAAFVVAVALLAAGRSAISGSLEAWYVDSLRLLDPLAPLSPGLSRGTAAEGIAMALGSLTAGGLVAIAGGDPGGALSSYGIVALAAAAAAFAYVLAVAVLVDEVTGDAADPERVRPRTREVLAVAVAEARRSGTVRIVLLTAAALGTSVTAIELLWQPRLAALAGGGSLGDLGFGLLSAGSMAGVALGAAASPMLRRRLGLRSAYVGALLAGAAAIGALGIPGAPAGFAVVFVAAYLCLGLAEPIHLELLNDAVGSRARATMISADSLAAQGGALIANLAVGSIAAAHGSELAWALAGIALALTVCAIAIPLGRTLLAPAPRAG